MMTITLNLWVSTLIAVSKITVTEKSALRRFFYGFDLPRPLFDREAEHISAIIDA